MTVKEKKPRNGKEKVKNGKGKEQEWNRTR